MEENYVLICLTTGALVLREHYNGKMSYPPKGMFQMNSDEALNYIETMQKSFPNEKYAIINLKTAKTCRPEVKKVLVDNK